MYSFSAHSKAQNKTLYPWLQLALIKTLRRHDFRTDQGGRTEPEQQALFDHDPPRTTLAPPHGKHLLRGDPTGQFSGMWSFAADVCPYIKGRRLATDKEGFGPEQMAQFSYFLACLKAEADQVLDGTGWEIRLGINWDMDAEIITDQSFDDWFHVEIVWKGA